MKPLKTIPFILIILTLFFVLPINSQNNRIPTNEEMATSIHDAFRDLVKNATLLNKPASTCTKHLEDILANDKESLRLLRQEALNFVRKVQDGVNANTKFKDLNIELGVFNDYTDKAINAYNSTVDFSAFMESFTGMPVGSIDKSIIVALEEYYWGELQIIFNRLRYENRQYYTSDYLCNRNYVFEWSIKEVNFPNIVWDISIRSNVSCNCVSDNDRFVDYANYIYYATVKGIFTGKAITMEEPINPMLRIQKLKCCGITPEILHEDIGVAPDNVEDPTENGSDTLIESEKVGWEPTFEAQEERIIYKTEFNLQDIITNSLGISAGVATAKDEETLFCIGLGIMFHVTNLAGNPFFVGARAKLQTASFSSQNFNQTQIEVGPSIEYQVPIGKTDTRWINGINGAFNFGSSDSSGFKTNISGFSVGLYTGLHVPLGSNFAIGVLLNLVEYNNQTFKADDNSFENKLTNTSFNFNKGSATLSLRVNLFKEITESIDNKK